MFVVTKINGDKVECWEFGDYGMYDGAIANKDIVVPFNLKKYVHYPVMWRDAKEIFTENHLLDAMEVMKHLERIKN